MNFSRISSTKKGVELAYEKKDEHKTEETVAKSGDTPLPTFRDALQGFAPFVCELLEIPDAWRAALTVTTLNLSIDKNGVRGLVVTATKPVAKASDRPLILNTPLVRESADGDGEAASGAMMLSDDVMKLITLVESEAVRYLNGEREQRELFDGDEEEDGEHPAAESFDERSAAAEVASTRKPHAAKKNGKLGKKGGRKLQLAERGD